MDSLFSIQIYLLREVPINIFLMIIFSVAMKLMFK